MIEKIIDVIFTVALSFLMLFTIFVVGVMIYDITHYKCAYCQNMISGHADTVICTDGRRYHAECYMRSIMEGENG